MAGISGGYWVIDWFKSEWETLVSAPATFVISALIFAFVGYLFKQILSQSKIETLEERLRLSAEKNLDFQQKLEVKSPDEAKQKIEALEARLIEFEAKMETFGPRKLSESKIVELSNSLAECRGSLISIIKDGASTDAQTLSSSFHEVFRRAGWKTESPMVLGLGNPPPSGIAISIPHPDTQTREHKLLVTAFENAGIKFDLRTDLAPYLDTKEQQPVAEILLTTAL